MQTTLTAKQIAAYDIGKSYKGMTLRRAWEAEIYGPDRVNAMAPIEAACFDAGVKGHDMPEYATGWRYGNIPESGYSRNHADNINERGLSVMAIDGEDDHTDGSFEMFAAPRPIVRVGGFRIGFVGSDGEPLIVGARVLQQEQAAA